MSAVARIPNRAPDCHEQIARRLFERGFGWEDAFATLLAGRKHRLFPGTRQAFRAEVHRLWREFHHLPNRGRA